MTSACIIAFGAISSLGRAERAVRAAEAESLPRPGIAPDAELAAAGLLRPFAARAAIPAPIPVAPAPDSGAAAAAPIADRAEALLRLALVDCAEALDRCRPHWRAERIGLAIGTSSGGLGTAERAFAMRREGRRTPAELAYGSAYFAPFVRAARAIRDVTLRPATQVLGACASSSIALGLALRWLELDRCDVVLAGGYDAIATLVARGFEALRATSAGRVRPFGIERDGMVLGEGAGVAALVRADDLRGAMSLGCIAGFGASTDAAHMTAPHREGAGLARAAERALAQSGLASEQIDLVSAHATATPYNDAAEARALARALGAHARPIVHAFKSQIGHTLGAAGILETLSALDALAREVAPPTCGSGDLDPACAVRMLARGARCSMRAALKLSAAFGGTNAALVLTREPPASKSHDRAPRRVVVGPAVEVRAPWAHARLGLVCGASASQLSRLDRLGELALSALAALSFAVGEGKLAGAGIVVGHAWATLGTCEDLSRRRAERGTALVEPRRFPATSPNAVAGECAIAFGLTGPSFAVGGGLHGGIEALAIARDLVEAGDADRIVVLAADAEATCAELARDAGRVPLAERACAVLVSTEEQQPSRVRSRTAASAPVPVPVLVPVLRTDIDGQVDDGAGRVLLDPSRAARGAEGLAALLGVLGCPPLPAFDPAPSRSKV